MNLRLCLLLLNIKNFVYLVEIQGLRELPHHSAWMEDGFDYPTDKKLIPDLTETYTVQNKLEYGDAMLKIQGQFLGLIVEQDNADEDDVIFSFDTDFFHSNKRHPLHAINSRDLHIFSKK